MALNTLKTRIALLYKTYAEWAAFENYIPMKGEVCFCEVPAESHVVTHELTIMFKVGNGVMNDEGVVTGTPLKDLPWASAKAADVYAWAKKENLDFEDLDDIFKLKLEAFIEQKAPVYTYRLHEVEANVWRLQKQIAGDIWEDLDGEVNIKAVVTRMNDLEASLNAVTTRVTKVENWIDADGIMTKSEIEQICPVS